MTAVLFNIIPLFLALAATETLHGIFRAAVLVPRMGKQAALKLSIFSASVLAFLVCYGFVPRMGYTDARQLLAVGFGAALFMALFDVGLARLVLRRPLRKSLRDFHPGSGNYLIFGLLLLISYPWLVMRLQN